MSSGEMPAEKARVHATVVGETPYQETCIVMFQIIKDKNLLDFVYNLF
jgi:hypothetical protein